ncbi:unnamed protein product [Adineta steineri]|uniref:Potassium channel domain-containing protein n=1 Tax=Adineta steineri TaxID=433720 RepID=A0A813PPQ5_9BILA|nr:unnamed protein product [Adineta steineri]CAF3686668.1 unnamed protein product [Adineta steineri]
MENILLINLLGKRFSIPYRIVANYPETLLGNKLLLLKYYRNELNDYYFERNPLLFPYILTYYTLEKKIFCPHNIPIDLLKHECQFFQLTNPTIYHAINKIETYQYFQEKKFFEKNHSFIDIVLFLISLLFMLTTSMETLNTNSLNLTWSLSYFIELFSTFFLTTIIVYQIIYKKEFFRNKYFLIDLFSTILSIILIASQNLIIITNYYRLNILILSLKTLRLFIVIAHLRILRLIILTFIQRFETICILVFINIIIIGSLSEITFAFERRQQEDQTNQTTMKTHFDAFWWATSLSFTIGFGHTDAHSTLTTIGRFCSYMLTFFGVLFNGLILQELIKGFLKIYREDTQ